jgi:hypothetical protein
MNVSKREKEALTERMSVRLSKTEREAIKSYAYLSNVSEGRALRLLLRKFLAGPTD